MKPMQVNQEFVRQIRTHLDAPAAQAGFTFSSAVPAIGRSGQRVEMCVYQANPREFVGRYPDLLPWVDETGHCVDLWVRWEVATGRVSAELEGMELAVLLDQHGQAGLAVALRAVDGRDLADAMMVIGRAVAVLLPPTNRHDDH
jgi:hypothetical protein